MSYPYSYDNLTGIDLGQCATFSHVLTDGIIDEFDMVELGKPLTFFVKFGSGTPKVSIINSLTDKYLVKDIAGVYSDVTTLHKITINIPEEWEDNFDGTDLWTEGIGIVKLDSNDSPLIFTRRVKIIKSENKCTTVADMTDLNSKLDTMDSSLRQILANVVDEINENQVIVTAQGWRMTI